MKDRTYHEESLITLLCKIEAMLNSRPLVRCSNDPIDFNALTVVRSAEVKLPNSLSDSSYSIFMLAGKVALNPTPYEKGEYFDDKVTLIFYKRIQVELSFFITALCFLLFWICSLHNQRERCSSGNKTFEFERKF